MYEATTTVAPVVITTAHSNVSVERLQRMIRRVVIEVQQTPRRKMSGTLGMRDNLTVLATSTVCR
jgi:hypothetical protein